MYSRGDSPVKKTLLFLATFLLFVGSNAGAAESLVVAVAANFALPMEEIGREFKEAKGITLQTTISSTGKLFAQIKNWAPYDLFLAADTARPELLFAEGLAGEPIVYAKGQAVLWSKNIELCTRKNWQDVLLDNKLKKIGIANPKTAPYGSVVKKALQQAGLWDKVAGKLVYAGNVGQSFQYAAMGTVAVSFTAASFTVSDQGQKGCFWPIPEADTVVQKACIISRSAKQDMAGEFLTFLQSPQVQKILNKYGYR